MGCGGNAAAENKGECLSAEAPKPTSPMAMAVITAPAGIRIKVWMASQVESMPGSLSVKNSTQ